MPFVSVQMLGGRTNEVDREYWSVGIRTMGKIQSSRPD